MQSRFIFRPVTKQTLERDATEIYYLTQKLIDSGDLVEGINYPLGRRETFAKAVANDLREGMEERRGRKSRFIAHVAVDRKTEKIVSYVGLALARRFRRGSSVLFKQVAKYPRRLYGWENWLITDITSQDYKRKGLATRLRKMNIAIFRERFRKSGKNRELFSGTALENLARRGLDDKTGFKWVSSVPEKVILALKRAYDEGNTAAINGFFKNYRGAYGSRKVLETFVKRYDQKYSSTHGIIARKEIRMKRRPH